MSAQGRRLSVELFMRLFMRHRDLRLTRGRRVRWGRS